MTNFDNRYVIVHDGNCLFRCFSIFLYNQQHNHMRIRNVIVQNVRKKWDYFKSFIVNNNDYSGVVNVNDYVIFMSKDGTWGNSVEIQSFVQSYNLYVKVFIDNGAIIEFGSVNPSRSLFLRRSGPDALSQYSVLQYQNEKFFYKSFQNVQKCNKHQFDKQNFDKQNYTKQYSDKRNCLINNRKRKIFSDDRNANLSKKNVKFMLRILYYRKIKCSKNETFFQKKFNLQKFRKKITSQSK